jgi:hypothetical protein
MLFGQVGEEPFGAAMYMALCPDSLPLPLG